MNKEEIRRQAYSRMILIEEQFTGFVPPDAQAYWLLNYLIAEGVRRYIDAYGLSPISVDAASSGRNHIGLGPLSAFEKDTIQFLNSMIEKEERTYERRNRFEIVKHI